LKTNIDAIIFIYIDNGGGADINVLFFCLF